MLVGVGGGGGIGCNVDALVASRQCWGVVGASATGRQLGFCRLVLALGWARWLGGVVGASAVVR